MIFGSWPQYNFGSDSIGSTDTESTQVHYLQKINDPISHFQLAIFPKRKPSLPFWE